MARKKQEQADQPSPEEMDYESAMAELELIIDRIEQGEIGLEESMKQRRRGDALIKRCRAVLDAAEQELEEASPDDDPEESDPPR